MRKLLLIIVFSLIFTLSASPEFWLEGAFIADRNFVSEEIATSFPAMVVLKTSVAFPTAVEQESLISSPVKVHLTGL